MDDRRTVRATALTQDAPSLASELRHSAMLFGLLAATIGGAALGLPALLKVLS